MTFDSKNYYSSMWRWFDNVVCFLSAIFIGVGLFFVYHTPHPCKLITPLIVLRLLQYQHQANANQERLYQLSNLILVTMMLARSQIWRKKNVVWIFAQFSQSSVQLTRLDSIGLINDSNFRIGISKWKFRKIGLDSIVTKASSKQQLFERHVDCGYIIQWRLI